MTLGEFIKTKRTELGMSRNMLATKTGISHTEVQRIETNERKMPSLKVLCSLASALNIPQEDLLKVAGYVPGDDMTAVERAFPGLKTKKQQETVEKIADGLSRNADLKDEDLDDLYKQVEMFIEYAKREKDS
ncbi:helix-turn-helix transcriptional regulator [Oribacterium sp. oral taxon 102]|uniref:helix-turn-helix domain-containing protein n=1 Tax=Oribacterium sp. oral taxon 102 TaxID=671214 RepID=UPI0015BAE246|nr:helix-turn-helix transcriptional regulator [Oribacterium sp. oral taxon 102]NWO20629.1 helix-turn-helix transcriptional regulator [Oribacterium sp. oral taxon 102]